MLCLVINLCVLSSKAALEIHPLIDACSVVGFLLLSISHLTSFIC
jgi:hypothetical protein